MLARVLARTAALTRGCRSRSSVERDGTTSRDGHGRAAACARSVRPRALRLAADARRRTPERPFRERADGLFDARFVLAPEREARLVAGAAGGEARTRLVSPAREDVAGELNVDPLAALDLERLAAATGGRFSSAARNPDFVPPVGGGPSPVGVRDLAPWCLLLALLAYLTDLAWRRRPSARSL